MITIPVKTNSKQYPIFLGASSWQKIPGFLEKYPSYRIALITNKTIAKKCKKGLDQIISTLPKNTKKLALPDGEKYKNQETLNSIYTWLLKNGYDRKTLILAFGGGVIGDMVGFAAATFMRGVPFIQIPTTLLSMVDSSIGGKVAVNHPLGKNMIGNFYQPEAVFMDIRAFDTLSHEEFENGMAEVIKHGVIRDANYFQFLEENIQGILNKAEAALVKTIHGSCLVKAEVVRKDEKEGGLRAILNYGHTFAHALEAVTDYQYFKHGQAVVHGMRAAGSLGMAMGLFPLSKFEQQEKLLKHLKWKKIPELNQKQLNQAMSHDKKASKGRLKFIVPQKIGKVLITEQVTKEDVRLAWEAIGISK